MYHCTPFTVPDGNVAHAHAPAGWPVPLVHSGSSQSTFPSQLSSIPLSQISVAPQHVPSADAGTAAPPVHCCGGDPVVLHG
jgi:hypothetical protein